MIHEDVYKTVSLEYSALARTKSIGGERLYSLGLGEPFWHTPQLVREKLSELAISSHFGYKSPYGNTELRRLLANKLSVTDNQEITLDNILIAAGSKHALSIALKVILDDDDEVIILDPCFVSYYPQVKLANHRAKTISCPLAEDFTIDFCELSKLITSRTKAILINTPNNPTGGLISKAEMDILIMHARDCGAYLICDEIYRDFIFEDAKFQSLNHYLNDYNKIITINGFSKTFGMTGWRLGYLTASREFITKAATLVQHEITNIPEILQIAACEVFALPSDWFEQYRKIIERNANYFTQEIKPISKLRTIPIKSGMFCFTKFDINDIGSDQMSVALLNEQCVAVTPGITFGKKWDSYLRISLSSKEDEFQEAIQRFIYFFSKF